MTAARPLDAIELRRWLDDARALLARLEARLAPANDASTETLDEWFERWLADRVRRGKGDERGKYERWIAPRLGWLPVVAIDRDAIDRWVEWVEERVLEGELRETTAHRVWTVLSAMMRGTYASPNRELRVRADNPIRDVPGPARGSVRVGTFLYPSEFLRLVSCRRVPIEARRRYALAVYLYPRAGELAALRWEDIDLRTGRAHIHRSRSRGRPEKSTKTGEDRQFVVEKNALPLLRMMRKCSRGAHVIAGKQAQDDARDLRRHLREAGCARKDLFADDERRRPLTFHDLRATGITWMAMRGDAPTAISERVGHLHLATTERYMRRGRLLAVASGERVFPRLPEALLGKK